MPPEETDIPAQTSDDAEETTAVQTTARTESVGGTVTAYTQTQDVNTGAGNRTASEEASEQSQPAVTCSWWVLGLVCMALGGCMLWEKKE